MMVANLPEGKALDRAWMEIKD